MKTINNKKGFTLVELLITIWIIIFLWGVFITMYDSQSQNDVKRGKAMADMQIYLQDFKQSYWVYPNSNSTGRRYPASWCSVNWYDSLISCLVAVDLLEEDSETYELLAYDPTEWEYNNFDQEYAYYYWTANKWNKFKICALTSKQSNSLDYKGLDGNDASEWSRYNCLTSANTKLTDVTSMNK